MTIGGSDLPSVYLETTIVGYLTSRPSRDIVVAARQAITREWWDNERPKYRIFISAHVIEEARAGNEVAADERMRLLERIEALEPTPEIEHLAGRVQSALDIPAKARLDAFHLAYAIQYRLDYLLTWNCTHLANASILRRLADFLSSEGLWLPIVCTPGEMASPTEES